MSFPLTSAKLQGYNPQQVDALMARVKTQNENPDLELVSAAVLAVAKFDLASGGYQIRAVDDAIAKIADTFEIREIERDLRKVGRAKVAAELAELLRTLKKFLEAEPKKRFDKSANGYSPKLVNNLIKRVEIRRSTIYAPDAYELRTASLGRSQSGYDRGQVDEFLSAVVSALHRQRILG